MPLLEKNIFTGGLRGFRCCHPKISVGWGRQNLILPSDPDPDPESSFRVVFGSPQFEHLSVTIDIQYCISMYSKFVSLTQEIIPCKNSTQK